MYYSTQWDSITMLDGITLKDLQVTDKLLEQSRDIIWGDLSSEYDAKHFSDFLSQSGLQFTPEFEAFKTLWRRDELNHYLGFRQIYSVLYEKRTDSIDQAMAAHQPNFVPIQEFLEDEFRVCVLIAYDELATTRTYAQDIALYKSFGSIPLANWIKFVIKDEGLHYDNALNVIAQSHSHRLPELRQLVNRLVEFNLEDNHQYGSTFVLNHEQSDYFSPAFLSECGDMLCKRFGR
jgi:hypothetical protein